ncbi:response regulator [Pseudidiomarina marina]|uniref:Two-component system response regulator n=1 Tax=Pseudidiomarina marina TaxID=502366 RepID=A0A432YKK1_9GAMM|nr:response regulator [Pseudidiomarina marina]PHR65336.1 MAG: two-component system response regulator [Idiomarina sp.]RUO61456.1 two-component system response regulator [Pseudidiomarina marina]
MSLQLLLVEDKPATREQLLQIIEQSPFTVSCANDGLDGLNRSKSQHFDVVLVDHKMPLMDGLALIKNLRQSKHYQQTPIILMTTQDAAQVQPLADKAGANLCLPKPVEAQRLLGLLNDLAATTGNPQQTTA